MVKLGQLEKVTDTALREMTTFQSVGHCPGITSTVVTTPARVGPSGCPPPATETCKCAFLILVRNLIEVFNQRKPCKNDILEKAIRSNFSELVGL